MRRTATHTLLLVGCAALLLASCGRHETQESSSVIVGAVSAVPDDPLDPTWESAPQYAAELLLQDIVDPRTLVPTTQRVHVRALSDDQRIAFRLSWDDATQDDLAAASRFPDGCAVQLPRAAGPDLPAPQMGEDGKEVEIAYWRATWQAVVDGRGDAIQDIFPRASVDHYPFEAPSLEEGSPEAEAMSKRYAPARALENSMAGPRDRSVEALLAQGPGTLTADPDTPVDGRGTWSDGRWSVVIVRPLPAALQGAGTQVAFGVWEGSHDEAGARKMRTGWIPLVRSES